jgi:tRNA modification GTPase
MSGDVIAAVSTPYGKGGIAVIRVSGGGAVSVCSRMFRPKNGTPLTETQSRRAVYGDITEHGDANPIDDGIAVVYRAPHSYTGEDMVEISCHGGILITEMVLQAVLASGASMAAAGEFTRRAFLNGKMGLINAEAAVDLIDAETAEQVRLAKSAAGNKLSAEVAGLYDKIKVLLANIYVYIDFPDEDLTDITPEEILKKAKETAVEIAALLETYKIGRAVNEGINTAIVGKPNAGKSSLFNALCGKDRAIVTDIAGTTRDVIGESAVIGRVLLRLCDTAGIRADGGDTVTDIVERAGIKRSLAEIDAAELIIAVFDSSCPLDANDAEFMEALNKAAHDKTVIAVLNKSDLRVNPATVSQIKSAFAESVSVSAVSGSGIEELKKAIEGMYVGGRIDYGNTAVIKNARQYAALNEAHKSVTEAVKSLESGFTQDVAGLDLERAMARLGEVDGFDVTDDITHEIFSRFCVGK